MVILQKGIFLHSESMRNAIFFTARATMVRFAHIYRDITIVIVSSSLNLTQ